MWKYVTRRIRDTFERGANHLDKRHSAVVNSSMCNFQDDKNAKPPCCWFMAKGCWKNNKNGKDTNNKRWNFDPQKRSWIGAMTWSSFLVFGWYTSQLIHLRWKKESNRNKAYCVPKITYLFQILPRSNKSILQPLKLTHLLEKSFENVPPVVHLVSNDHSEGSGVSSNSTEASDDLGEVLNSIENRLGLAAIENGQHQDGLNLLRSAANRNHAPALYNLALCYEQGMGVETDEKIAMELYRSAAALQHPGALYNLGIYYGQGRGSLSRDRATAVRLVRLAAVQGHQEAITALKFLEEPPESPPVNDIWAKPFSTYAKQNNIVPTHSTLFVENVNALNATCYNYEPMVY